jgi:hypothetical protein
VKGVLVGSPAIVIGADASHRGRHRGRSLPAVNLDQFNAQGTERLVLGAGDGPAAAPSCEWRNNASGQGTRTWRERLAAERGSRLRSTALASMAARTFVLVWGPHSALVLCERSGTFWFQGGWRSGSIGHRRVDPFERTAIRPQPVLVRLSPSARRAAGSRRRQVRVSSGG